MGYFSEIDKLLFKFLEKFSELLKIFQMCQTQKHWMISQKLQLPLDLLITAGWN